MEGGKIGKSVNQHHLKEKTKQARDALVFRREREGTFFGTREVKGSECCDKFTS